MRVEIRQYQLRSLVKLAAAQANLSEYTSPFSGAQLVKKRCQQLLATGTVPLALAGHRQRGDDLFSLRMLLGPLLEKLATPAGQVVGPCRQSFQHIEQINGLARAVIALFDCQVEGTLGQGVAELRTKIALG